MGSAVIFSGSAVKALKKEIKLGSGASVISGTTDPTLSAISAVAGSLYQNETTGKIYRKLDAGSSTNWIEIKESTAKNYILNPDASLDTTGWSVYKDVAGSLPVDGTGTISAPNITWTRTTSSPLSGAASFLLTKPSPTNCQGEGVSYDFTIDLGDDNGGVFVASCSYMPTSGTFSGGSETTDSDVTVYIVSKEFGTVIQPSYYKLQASVNDKAAKSTAYFQLPVSAGGGSARQFRLCYHVATVSTAAYTVKFDEVSVGPKTDNSFLYGTGKLPTIQKFTSTGAFTWNRPDGVAYIKVKMVGGGGGGASSGAGLGLPGGTGGDSTFGANLTAGGGTGGATMTPGTFSVGGSGGSCTVTETATIKQILACTGGNGESGEYYEDQSHGGEGGASALGGAGTGGFGTIAGTTGKANTGGGGGGGGMNATDSSGAGGGAGAYLEAIINNPDSTYTGNVGIGGAAGASGGGGSFAGLGGGSGVVIVEEYYTPTDATISSLVTMSAGKTTGSHTASGSWQDVTSWDLPLMDRGGNFNATTGVYTVNEPGDYDIFGSISFVYNATGNRAVRIYYNNSIAYSGGEVVPSATTLATVPFGKTLPCKSGDTIRIQAFQNSGVSVNYDTFGYNSLSICKRQSSQISPSEKIAAKYTSVTADAIGTSLATLTYPTKVFDTHNAYSGGFFTAPAPGKYFFKASVITNPVTLSTGQALAIEVRKNSSTLIDSAQTIGNGASNYWSVQTSGFIELNYGETVDVQVKSSVATSVGASASYNTFEIFRI